VEDDASASQDQQEVPFAKLSIAHGLAQQAASATSFQGRSTRACHATALV